MGELFPVIVAVYDAEKDVAYWLHVQEQIQGGKIFGAARAGTRMTLHVPLGQVLDASAIHEFRRRKQQPNTGFWKGGL